MHSTKKITQDLTWVGADDRRLAMFEGVYSVPYGVSYNAYLLCDEQTVLFDTVDKAVSKQFFENLSYGLGSRSLDYVVVSHMEPDHSATLFALLERYPHSKVVCNAKIQTMIRQFFDIDLEQRVVLVAEGDVLCVGRHTLQFYMAPMVHWPEVMVSYDKTDKILFSADAFGTFGALNGAIFADEVDFYGDYLHEARRYYTNIVGKYGPQVQALLKKAAGLEIEMICPLHGFVHRRNLGDYIEKYDRWSTYTPEEQGVLIAYASVYGNTENAAQILACRLRDRGIKVCMFDVSVTPASEIIAAAFRYSHMVFASTTYNAGIFVSMDELLRDLAAHNIQNRTVAFIENGSWAPTSGKLMREIFSSLKNITFLQSTLSIKSSMKEAQYKMLVALVDEIEQSMQSLQEEGQSGAPDTIDTQALQHISYGLFVLSARQGEKDNACIINTLNQITDTPAKVAIAVNKQNYTCTMIAQTKHFTLSVLTESVPFKMFERFGFQSGRDVDKFLGMDGVKRAKNGVYYVTQDTNAYIAATVVQTIDCGTHMLFIAEVEEAEVLSDDASVTYAYYFSHIKPKAQLQETVKQGFVCKVCGYVYEGDVLPEDFICPLCKHGADAFERIK